jgi:hypothetical protein
MPSPAFSVTIPAVVDVATHGRRVFSFPLTVRNHTDAPIAEHVYVADTSPAVKAHPLPAGWHLSMHPAHLTVPASGAATVTVTVVTSGGCGQVCSVNVTFAAVPAAASQARLAGALSAKVSFSGSGALTAAPPPGGLTPLQYAGWSIALLGVLGAAVVTGRLLWLRHRTARRHLRSVRR